MADELRLPKGGNIYGSRSSEGAKRYLPDYSEL